MNLIIKGYIEISLQERDKSKVKLDKPTLSALVLHQVNNQNSTWVTNVAHEPISVNFFDKFALKYMNGKNSKKQILDYLIEEAKNGQITLNKDNSKIEDVDQIKKELSTHLDNTIDKMSMQGLLK
jgi:methyltransferase-like protein